MKKIIFLLISFTLILSVVCPSIIGIASTGVAENNHEIEGRVEVDYQFDFEYSDEELTEEINEDFQENLIDIAEESGIDNVEELNAEITEVNESELSLETNLENEELSANMEVTVNSVNDDIELAGEVTDADGKTTSYNYNVVVTELAEDTFKATFIDNDTGEFFEYDNTELNASAVPILVYIIGAKAVEVTVKYVAKKAVLYIGKRTFKKVSNNVVKSALKNFKPFTVKAGKYKISVSKGKMEHILKNHHPRYWTGKEGKTMFDPDLSINDVKNIISTVIRKDASDIEKALKKGSKANAVAKVNGIKYEVVVTKDKTVSTAYPLRKQ